MNIEKFISDSYQVVGPFEGINAIEDKLLRSCYMVVLDDNRRYHGILTPHDLIAHPHKIVIDCLGKKESISFDDSAGTIIEKFRTSNCIVLPVIKDNKFVGVIEKNRIIGDYESIINDLYNKSLISHKAKTSFLNNLSHEIRTPLNSVLGFLDIISTLNEDDYEKKEITRIIKESADRFLLIMNDLVDLSLLDAGEDITIDKKEVKIEEIFIELQNYFNEIASTKNKPLSIYYLNPNKDQTIITDKMKLKHVLFHLIDNAIKFSSNKKVMYGYKVSVDKKDIDFFVVNESHDLSDEISLKMFDLFEKQENIGEDINFGLGIGLPLVKKITERLGGKVRLELKKPVVTCYLNFPMTNAYSSCSAIS